MSERGSYRSIPNALLAGPDFRRLSERARWIFVVLKMNMGAVGIDVWYPDELVIRLAAESGATPDQVRLTLDILEHENWIRREDNLIWVVGHLEHDPHWSVTDPKHRKSVQRTVAGLPHSELVRRFIAENSGWFPPEEAASMGLQWAMQGPSKGLRRGKSKPRRAIAGPSKHDNDNEDENETSAPNDGAAAGEPWPSSWAYDTSRILLENGVVEKPGVIGEHTKPLKDSMPWSEWRRIVVRLAKAGDCAFGWPQALRRVRNHRDADQPDPNRDLSLDELREMSA